MSRFLPLSLIFLLGCPVEPKDIQDLNNDGPGKPGNGQGQGQMNGGNTNMGGQGMNGNPNMGGPGSDGGQTGQDGQTGQGGQTMGGPPPGSPMEENGIQGPLPEGEGINGQEMNGTQGDGTMNAQNPLQDGSVQQIEGGSGQPPQGMGDAVPSLPMGEGEQIVTDEDGKPQFENGPLGDVPATLGKQGDVQTPEGTHPTPDFAHQPGSIPVSAGDVLPMYQEPPSFIDFMGDDQITIELEVLGATSFDFEFVVKREGDGRIYPKVLHKQANATSPVTIAAPSTIEEPVWLVITADNTGDGPTPDDLVGGTTEALLFSGKNMNLSYTLQADDAFMQSLPWFSQAQGTDGPEFER